VSQTIDAPASQAVIPGIGPTTLTPGGDFETERRQELRRFLMSRRARLQPADVGLPETARRRTPGLRREEVAQLAGLSAEWYTLFEMAKDLRVSTRTVDAVAKALRLNDAETRHLHGLVSGDLPQQAPTATGEDVDPALLAVLDGYTIGPAMLLNTRMDVIGANRLAGAVFGDLMQAGGDGKNWLWYLYANHERIREWETQARQVAATFRGVFCQHATEQSYADLVRNLSAVSEPFRAHWESHDVSRLDGSLPLTIEHATFGTLRFTMQVLGQPGATAMYCCFLVPDGESARALSG
jgi:MmyB-like transcription regulator ligand binding domain/Helix-turn-helix domain